MQLNLRTFRIRSVWLPTTRLMTLALVMLHASLAQAANVNSFSPQGDVAQVRQARAAFSEAMVNFGDPKAATPFDVNCPVAGSPRWADAKNWVYDFERDVPPGMRCSFTLKAGIKTLAGANLSGTNRFEFSTGGPAVVRYLPTEDVIEEEQAFILFQNAAATADSVREHLYCEAEGVHERIAVKFVSEASRKELLKQFAKEIDPATVTIVQCQQRLPNDAAVKLTWDRGIKTTSGIATTVAQTFKFKVRKEFTASLTCQRENANAACSPILPLTLFFSEPVPRKLAESVEIKGRNGKIKPAFEKDDKAETVQYLNFKPPFAENDELSIHLPSGFKDESGRTLSNASMFPLKTRTAGYPPLAKFPAAPFGIIELNADATLPVTLRRVESNLMVRGVDGKQMPGKVANLKVDDDKGVIAWLTRLNRYHERWGSLDKKDIDSRGVGLLAKEPGVKVLDLPVLPDAKEGERPFEVVGIPLRDPGFYVVELASQKLGASLLGKPVPMYVRTSALVTNLSVHVKLARENGAVWVTTLDAAKPVANAEVRISNCKGEEVWRGKTGASGVAVIPNTIEDACAYRQNPDGSIRGLFVSARKTDEKGRADMAFALTSWNDGIEPWRFNLPTEQTIAATTRAHTIFDRTLLRAGETVSMKHELRVENMRGFGLASKDKLPTRVRVMHDGSGQEFQFPLVWRGQKNAETVFVIPKDAKLGSYSVMLDGGKVKSSIGSDADNSGSDARSYSTGGFRVEEFRLPLMQGRLTPVMPATSGNSAKGMLVAPKTLSMDAQLNYLNGGGASGKTVHITSLMRPKAVSFSAYDGYSFDANGDDYDSRNEDEEDAGGKYSEQKIVADKLAVTLDKQGAGRATIQALPAIKAPRELLTEMTYSDPNGEIQTISNVTPLWPSAVVVGIKAGNWVSVKRKLVLSMVVLNPSGQPQSDVTVEVNGLARQTNSHRKRMVGGFYAYENTKSSQNLGKLCSGKTDKNGMLTCEVALTEPGNVELKATAKDGSGNASFAKTSVWVTGQGELWFDGENQDRIDILPEKKTYQPGETAKFQVRMPFRYATALVAIEREGVMETQVVQLNGRDPSISLPIKGGYAPNVYVSVLAVRGRMREVPWYSFFSWGWKEPLNWWQEFREYQAPGPMIDLAKPAYKFGIAEIAVGSAEHQLKVAVTADKTSYPIRSTAKVNVQVHLPDGKPAAGAEIALAAVDEALLELEPNTSWNLLSAMMQRRSYGVTTSTAQMQVIGKRHYGKKAMPAGGGGGKAPTRELFDTLLLWKPVIVLDANGRAQIDVPLNDALTAFRIVAVAESGASLFGTGSVSIRSTQDVQIISGLPPLVREGDQFAATVTVRNTTARAMQIRVLAKAGNLALPDQDVAIGAGEAREVVWQVSVPTDAMQLDWEINAREQAAPAARDSIKLTQRVVPAVPVTVQQATLFQLDKSAALSVAQPAGSLPGRGGIQISLKPNLSSGNEGLRKYFTDYLFTCLEQRTSKAIGLRDEAQWQKIVSELPTYLDADGLAYYFPPSETNARRGSDTLTAYLLAASNEAGYALPIQSRDKMLNGLAAFVDGKVMRDFWAPKKDLDIRKLSALEALSRYQRVQPAMLGSLQINPNLWPTSAIIDWVAILQRVTSIPEREKRLAEADQILRSRLNFQGTRLSFSSEESDYWWWLMASGDSNANRLILTMLNQPAWREDMPRLISAAIARQQRGHWSTTTANVWGSLALEKFSRTFEAEKVTGVTRVASDGGSNNFAWNATTAAGGKLQLPWGTPPPGSLKLSQDGTGKPWVTVQSLAALPITAPFSSGYRISKNIVAVEQKQKGAYSRGDVLRITLDIDAQSDMTWVALSDPIPGGASLLGSGLGRDSAIASSGDNDSRARSNAWLAYEERSFEGYRAYYEFLPKGRTSISYTVRLNNAGDFNLPPTRAEAMYAPEMFGEIPNAKMTIKAQ